MERVVREESDVSTSALALTRDPRVAARGPRRLVPAVRLGRRPDLPSVRRATRGRPRPYVERWRGRGRLLQPRLGPGAGRLDRSGRGRSARPPRSRRRGHAGCRSPLDDATAGRPVRNRSDRLPRDARRRRAGGALDARRHGATVAGVRAPRGLLRPGERTPSYSHRSRSPWWSSRVRTGRSWSGWRR